MYVLEPQIQIRNDCLLFYQLPVITPGRNSKLSLKKAYSGIVTDAGAKRLRKAIDILVQRTPIKTIYNPVTKKYFPFQFNFVTLTISSNQNVDTAMAGKQLLEPFLRKMRSQGSFSYVWKAEFQTRGQLHYHLATNTFLTWQKIRSVWNNLQRKNRLLDEYAEKHGHFDPNSTDVHAKGGVTNMAAYMSKYLAKSGTQKMKGKVWDCSKDCKGKRFAFTPTGEQEIELVSLQQNKHLEIVKLEHCTLIKGIKPAHFLTPTQLLDYQTWRT